jgi:hypothetical protein
VCFRPGLVDEPGAWPAFCDWDGPHLLVFGDGVTGTRTHIVALADAVRDGRPEAPAMWTAFLEGIEEYPGLQDLRADVLAYAAPWGDDFLDALVYTRNRNSGALARALRATACQFGVPFANSGERRTPVLLPAGARIPCRTWDQE